VDAGQLRGAARQRVQRDAHPWHDQAAHIAAARLQHLHGGGRAHVDENQRGGILPQGRHGDDDEVRAHLGAVGTYFNWLIVAKRLRNYSARIDAITVPDFFSKRYRDKSNILLGLAALVIIVFFVPYTASGFAACGKLFGTLFGIDYHIAMVVSAIVIVGYTSLGGFNAASTTDFIQSIIMSVALVIVLCFGVSQAGGINAIAENAKSFDGYLDMFKSYNPETNAAGNYTALTIFSTLAWGLGYFGMPHILLRFMAIEDPHKIKLSRRVATIWVVISMAVAVLIGVVGLGMVANPGNGFEALADSETIIVQIANLLSTRGFIFALIAGIILAGILASTMSTADSQLLAASSSMSENILGGLFKLKLNETAQMVVARVTLIVISVIGVILAWDSNSNVFKIVSFAWAGFGAAFGPTMLLALFWKRSNKYGAMAGMFAGGAMIFIWKFAVRPMGGILDIYELLPAFIVGLVVNILISLFTAAPDEKVVKAFEEVKEIK
ncbi:MAG: sodium/proline symporter, partial [Eubacterium sp.]|nr:sodium/proline symporter [Eubacterium sp.]